MNCQDCITADSVALVGKQVIKGTRSDTAVLLRAHAEGNLLMIFDKDFEDLVLHRGEGLL